ncbi:thiamine-phosphate kinase [Amycolatopsis alkalitolerans]|uniref:Thiamine-monophosphate kinase n=1 Tax=Amycolatopsis alkalitolerans TaxID=2547244 RepID=A0A5C4LV81_9PSEU|nr:thiamine-phosphate kinase [Amycolatopsis alkalitolerans]TNC22928.1 thiamine-monophosphate kinase [Amycolatopsis alkalitolerans]
MSGRPDGEECLGDLGERQILEKVLRPRYAGVAGFGDDAAVLGVPIADRAGGELVATTDSCPTPLVTVLGEADLFHTGWLLVTINLSDLAAAGASPLGLVVNYTLPATTTVREFQRLLDGVDACVAEHGTRVVGGDLRDGGTMQLSATAIGQCLPDRRLGRAGASAGDRLLLIGQPGYLWAWAFVVAGRARLPEAQLRQVRDRAFRPTAQLTAGRVLAESGAVRATMDVSDGLFATVRTLCEANDLGARIDEDIRLDPAVESVCEQAGVRPFDLAQTWGDWSLVAAVPAGSVEAVIAALAAEAVPAREIGELAAAGGGYVLTGPGGERPWQGIAQERFSSSSWHGDGLDRMLSDLSRTG